MWRYATLCFTVACVSFACRPEPSFPSMSEGPPVLPGEYEPAATVVVIWDPDFQGFYSELLATTTETADALVVVGEAEDVADLDDQLELAGADLHRVGYSVIPHESVWIRDFGPLVTRHGNDRLVVDLDYIGRHLDDAAARTLGDRWSLPTIHVPLELEGGNLLSDGRGRCVLSELTLEDNGFGYSETVLRTILSQHLGCKTVIFVPYLEGESTGHVDMFAMITGPNEAIVGSYQPDEDPENSRRLDIAAARMTRAGFVVRRAPMPSNVDGKFRTHVNSIAVNNTVLVPTYDDDSSVESEALAVFRQAYPDRDVVPIDASALIEYGGAVHCAALTVAQ